MGNRGAIGGRGQTVHITGNLFVTVGYQDERRSASRGSDAS